MEHKKIIPATSVLNPLVLNSIRLKKRRKYLEVLSAKIKALKKKIKEKPQI